VIQQDYSSSSPFGSADQVGSFRLFRWVLPAVHILLATLKCGRRTVVVLHEKVTSEVHPEGCESAAHQTRAKASPFLAVADCVGRPLEPLLARPIKLKETKKHNKEEKLRHRLPKPTFLIRCVFFFHNAPSLAAC